MKLELRVASLETGGLTEAQASWQQEQDSRVDAGRRSLSFAGFADDNDPRRLENIEKRLKDTVGSDVRVISVDHIWKGAPGSRAMRPLSIVKLASNSIRESLL